MNKILTLTLVSVVLLMSGCSAPEEDQGSNTTKTDPQQTETPEIIPMRFAWPPDTRADVTFVREKTEHSSGFGHKQTLRGSYKLLTQRVPKGLLINRHEQRIEIDSGDKELLGPDQQAQEFLARTAAISPMFVVGDQGRVLGFYNIKEFKQELLDAANQWADDIRENSPMKKEVPRIIEKLTADEFIEQSLIAVWNRETALWSGQRLQVGKPYSIEGTQSFSALDHINVPVDLTITLHGRVPCEVLGETLACVEVEYAYELDQDQIEEVERRYLEVADDGRKGVLDPVFKYSMRTILEPDTLMPHKQTENEEQSYTLQWEGRSDSREKRIIKTETSYDYTLRPDVLYLRRKED